MAQPLNQTVREKSLYLRNLKEGEMGTSLTPTQANQARIYTQTSLKPLTSKKNWKRGLTT